MNYLDCKEKPKDGYGWIYKYTSPSGKSYIGQTTYSLYERAGLNGRCYQNCSTFYAAIQKYGFENFTVEILDEIPESDLEEVESYYIQQFNTLLPNGYNYHAKGSGPRAMLHVKTVIDVYDLELNYIETFNSLIECARKYNIPYQAISACINHEIDHYKDRVYVKNGEKPNKPHVIQTHGRRTGQYDLDGNLIAVYNSANEAARAIGKNSNAGRNIRSVCSGDRQSAYGFKWQFVD